MEAGILFRRRAWLSKPPPVGARAKILEFDGEFLSGAEMVEEFPVRRSEVGEVGLRNDRAEFHRAGLTMS